MADNFVHFVWTPATGNPDGYLYEVTSGQVGQIYSESLYVPWSWAGDGNEIAVRVQAFRSNVLGEVIEVGNHSEWSVPVIIVPEPGGVALATGLLLLCLLGRKRRT